MAFIIHDGSWAESITEIVYVVRSAEDAPECLNLDIIIRVNSYIDTLTGEAACQKRREAIRRGKRSAWAFTKGTSQAGPGARPRWRCAPEQATVSSGAGFQGTALRSGGCRHTQRSPQPRHDGLNLIGRKFGEHGQGEYLWPQRGADRKIVRREAQVRVGRLLVQGDRVMDAGGDALRLERRLHPVTVGHLDDVQVKDRLHAGRHVRRDHFG